MKELEFRIIEREEYKDYRCYDCPYPCDMEKENCRYNYEELKTEVRSNGYKLRKDYRRYVHKKD